MKYFKHALQIDGENVEALVAQGALWVSNSVVFNGLAKVIKFCQSSFVLAYF